MKIVDDMPSGLSALDRPNSYIGRSVPRPNLARLTQGPRPICHRHRAAAHGPCRLRALAACPCPHRAIETAAAKHARRHRRRHRPRACQVITPWVGVLTHLKGIKSAPQHAIAIERACWQGEAVCAVVARSRAEAEDACALVDGRLRRPAGVTDAETALDAGTPVIHPELGDNLTFERVLNAGEPDQGFAAADAVIETTFCSAATPASPTSRAPSSPTGIPARRA